MYILNPYFWTHSFNIFPESVTKLQQNFHTCKFSLYYLSYNFTFPVYMLSIRYLYNKKETNETSYID